MQAQDRRGKWTDCSLGEKATCYLILCVSLASVNRGLGSLVGFWVLFLSLE
jgi:hypothetical protein